MITHITAKATPYLPPPIKFKGCYYPPIYKHTNMENEMNYLVADENCKEVLSEFNSALPTELIPLIKNVSILKRATKNRCSFINKISF